MGTFECKPTKNIADIFDGKDGFQITKHLDKPGFDGGSEDAERC